MARTPHLLGSLALATATALTLAACGSSGSSGSTATGSTSTTDWSTAQSADSGGGMDALVAAAKKEGTLNVIALPPDWANYAAILSSFKSQYGLKINSENPGGSSGDEINALTS